VVVAVSGAPQESHLKCLHEVGQPVIISVF
jgi:hypothetical protein